MIKRLLVVAGLAISCAFSASYAANLINLRELPQQQAKVVANIDVAQGYMPIFTQADGQWIKIADPHNGNVGWVTASELQTAQKRGKVAYSQRVISQGEAPQLQVLQFSNLGVQPLSNEEAEQYSKMMIQQQQTIQRAHFKAMQMVFDEMQKYFKYQMADVGPIRNIPPVQPVAPRNPSQPGTGNPTQPNKK